MIDRVKTNKLYPRMSQCSYAMKESGLCKQIEYFGFYEPESIMMPLKNLHKIKMKYTDYIQILAFAYASVFKYLVGNVTHKLKRYPDFYRKNCEPCSFARYGYLDESIFDDRNVALSVKNKFSSLRFVSCGFRGLENLQIEQFVSVFEFYVWKWLLAIRILIVVAMNLHTGSMCSLNVLNKVTCLIKVILEQGDPFPGRLGKSKPLRFLICGALLGGLVLSNAIKSNNVYNIVLPKQPLKFSTIDELLQHGYTIYTRLTSIYYTFYELDSALSPSWATSRYDLKGNRILRIFNSESIVQIFHADTEIFSIFKLITVALEEPEISPTLIEKELSSHSFLNNVSVPHLGLHDIIVEPLKILGPLFKVGLIDKWGFWKILQNTIQERFWIKQEKFIADDLKKCNKSAWLLPDYRAQQMTRLLHQSEMYSDVGITSYLNTRLNFKFDGQVSSSLLQRASMVSSSGLLKWWSDLINRTENGPRN